MNGFSKGNALVILHNLVVVSNLDLDLFEEQGAIVIISLDFFLLDVAHSFDVTLC